MNETSVFQTTGHDPLGYNEINLLGESRNFFEQNRIQTEHIICNNVNSAPFELKYVCVRVCM